MLLDHLMTKNGTRRYGQLNCRSAEKTGDFGALNLPKGRAPEERKSLEISVLAYARQFFHGFYTRWFVDTSATDCLKRLSHATRPLFTSLTNLFVQAFMQIANTRVAHASSI